MYNAIDLILTVSMIFFLLSGGTFFIYAISLIYSLFKLKKDEN